MLEIMVNDPKRMELEKQSIFLFGEPKIGKSTWASQRPNTFFCFTEPRIGKIKCDYISVKDFNDVEEFLKMLEKKQIDPEKYNTIVIDTIDNFIHHIFQEVCKKYGVSYVGDVPHGKGWDRVKTRIREQILRIFATDLTPIFISHQRVMEINFQGRDISKIVPTINNQGREMVLPLVSIIAHMFVEPYIEGGQRKFRRVINCAATPDTEAGDATGIFNAKVICEPEESCYNNFVEAWNSRIGVRNE